MKYIIYVFVMPRGISVYQSMAVNLAEILRYATSSFGQKGKDREDSFLFSPLLSNKEISPRF